MDVNSTPKSTFVYIGSSESRSDIQKVSFYQALIIELHSGKVRHIEDFREFRVVCSDG